MARTLNEVLREDFGYSSMYQLEDEYESYLNDVYGEVDVCGSAFLAGSVLREMDPIAFTCGCNDWVDDNYTIVDGDKYYTKDDVNSAQETVDEENDEEEDEEE